MSRRNSEIRLIVIIGAALLLACGVVSAQESTGRLDGVHIYFSEDSNEASIFDRSEAGISRIAGLLQGLGAELFTLNWRVDIPADADLVIIAGPTRDLSSEQIVRLWVYLVNGGKLLLFAEPLVTTVSDDVITIQTNRALLSGRGFFELTWADFGTRGRDDVLLPNSPSTFSVESAEDFVTEFETSVNEESVVTIDADTPLKFFGARSIEFDGSIQRYRATPLIYAPREFYGERAFADFVESGIVDFNTGLDTTPEQLSVAVAVEQSVFDSRMIIIGDRQFVSNGGGLQTSPANSTNFVYPGNVEFVLNSIGWLLGIESQLSIPIEYSTAVPVTVTTEEATQESAAEMTPEATQESAAEMTPEATQESTPESEGS